MISLTDLTECASALMDSLRKTPRLVLPLPLQLGSSLDGIYRSTRDMRASFALSFQADVTISEDCQVSSAIHNLGQSSVVLSPICLFMRYLKNLVRDFE